jgi:hypothetical protein
MDRTRFFTTAAIITNILINTIVVEDKIGEVVKWCHRC